VVPSGAVREPLAEFVDVLPSVARLLDREPPADYLEKRRTDLFTDGGTDGHAYAFAEWRAWSDGERARLARRNPSYRRFDALARDLVSARDRRFKLVRSSDGREELFDLDADPGEGTDVGASQPGPLSTLRGQLDARGVEWAAWESGPSAEITSEERAEIESRLEDLGYI
jgi:arylsulfatase A-like enzyme